MQQQKDKKNCLQCTKYSHVMQLNAQVFIVKQIREKKKYKIYKFMCSSSIYKAQKTIFYKQFMSGISVQARDEQQRGCSPDVFSPGKRVNDKVTFAAKYNLKVHNTRHTVKRQRLLSHNIKTKISQTMNYDKFMIFPFYV